MKKRPKSGSPLWRRLLPYLIGALVLGIILAGFRPTPVPVQLAEVTRGTLRITVLEEGKTRIPHRYVVSAPIAGVLSRVPHRAGAEVRAGETVLAIIRPEQAGFLHPRTLAEAEARVSTAEAARNHRTEEVERAASALRLAELEHRRAERLRRDQAISEQEWEQVEHLLQTRQREKNAAQFALEMATFELRQAEAALLSAEQSSPSASAEPFQVRSPVDGYVLQVFEESERVVRAGEAILEVGDPGTLEAEIEVLSSDAVGVRPGALVEIEHWGGDSPLQGRVTVVEPGGFTKISPLGVEEQRVLVRVEFEPPAEEEGRLGDRYRVEARIVVWEEDDVLQVPSGALFRRGNQWVCFVAGNDGRAVLREVELRQHSGTAAQVVDGLKEGELVILYPPDTLEEGSRVTSAH